MLYSFVNYFTKITAWPIQKIIFATKIIYEDKALQSRKIKGPAILVSNHTSVFDFAAYLFVFFGRTLRFQMAELLFKKPVLGVFLKMLGGILVDRNVTDYSFMNKSAYILNNGGVVGVFPEGRIPKPEEIRPLQFKVGAAFLALQTGVPIIPLYTNGSYFKKERAKVVIGAPIYPEAVESMEISDKDKLEKLTEILRNKIIELEKICDEN